MENILEALSLRSKHWRASEQGGQFSQGSSKRAYVLGLTKTYEICDVLRFYVAQQVQ